MRNLRTVIAAAAVVIVLYAAIAPAAAWSFSNIFSSSSQESTDKKLDDIEAQIDELSSNEKLMKFINRNLWEQNVKTIECAITEDGEVLDTYYIVREKKGDPATIEDDGSGTGNTWTFKPTIKETEKALRLLQTPKLTISNIAHCLILMLSVESEGVPSIDQLIDQSTWIGSFLPIWW